MKQVYHQLGMLGNVGTVHVRIRNMLDDVGCFSAMTFASAGKVPRMHARIVPSTFSIASTGCARRLLIQLYQLLPQASETLCMGFCGQHIQQPRPVTDLIVGAINTLPSHKQPKTQDININNLVERSQSRCIDLSTCQKTTCIIYQFMSVGCLKTPPTYETKAMGLLCQISHVAVITGHSGSARQLRNLQDLLVHSTVHVIFPHLWHIPPMFKTCRNQAQTHLTK